MLTNLLLLSVFMTTPFSDSDLENKIHSVIDQDDARIAVTVIPHDKNAPEFDIRGDETYHAASTYKTPVMLKAFRRSLDDPEWNIGDSLTVYNEFESIVDGSVYQISEDQDRPGIAEHIGSQIPIRLLVEHMIIQSGNLATNILIDQLNAESVTEFMHGFGLTGLQIRRGVFDMPAFEEGINNEVTARDLARMYHKLAAGEMFDEATTNSALDILKRQTLRDKLPANLPEAIEIAHKGGSITGVNHDAGIVYLNENEWYSIAILSDDSTDEDTTINRLAEISEIIFEHYSGKN